MIHKFKTNINCNNCKRTVSFFLDKEVVIEKWELDMEDPDRVLTAEGDNLNSDKVVEIIQKAGFKAEIFS